MEESIYKAKLVDGYNKAFIDSLHVADNEFCPQLLTNAEGRKVITTLEKELRSCDELFISVAFVTRSGVTPLLQTFEELEKRGVKGRILTTDYLLFSEPSALDTLDSLGNIELRVFKTSEAGVGFHTKGYMFHNNGFLRAIVGSSNLTQNALAKNCEWNTRFVSTLDGQYAKDIEKEFNGLWNLAVDYRDYREEYSRYYEAKVKQRKELHDIYQKLDPSSDKPIEPNEMQQEFIDNIERLLRSGENRALLVSATGTGKTYASALAIKDMFSKSFSINRKVLFVSHREQINRQALKSYQRIFGSGVNMALLSGSCQNVELIKKSQFIFSTVNMLAKDDVRESYFEPDEFSVVVLDECHRTGSASYQRIIDYFQPDLLLGMSASPERTDDFDVFSLFDHNIASEIRLQRALENDLLCPFHYFGITDLFIDGQQTDVDRFKKLTSDKRIDYILSKAEYYGYSGKYLKGLIFCGSNEEAKVLSEKINATGKYKTLALSGSDSIEARQNAIDRLVSEDMADRLDYLLTVDIFNEGVDIPEINQVIFLRQTQSPIVFVQQLGRGLRKFEGKEYVVVLDFIGNYNNDYMIPIALSGDRTGNKDNIRRAVMDGGEIKGVSTIHFDAIAKQRIYKSIDSAKLNGKRLLREEYHRLKCKIGRVPELMDFDEHGELDPLRIMDTYGSYYNFLKDVEKEDYNVDLDEVMEQMLFFVSTKLASGKRPHELLLLKLLIHDYILNHSRGAFGEMTDDEISDVALIRTKGSVVEAWKSVMLKKYSIQVDELCELNVRNVLTNVFFAIGSAANTFDKCVFLTKEGNISKNFEKALKNQDFRSLLLSVVSFGLYRNTRDYSNRNKGSQFVINQKYTYDEVCRLLNWEKNQVATNIGGYKYDSKTKTYPVFVNYHKEEGISETIKYEDRFISPTEMVAISKRDRKIKSPDVQTALNSVELGVTMDLFVRKNKEDKDSKEFYYLGSIYPTGKVEEFKMPNTNSSAVKIYYNLETPVKPSLYEYITEEVI